MRSLDIVIVSYNAREDLRACLQSLLDGPPQRPWTVTVVDNASRDASADAVAEIVPAATVIRLAENVGFARGTNIGVRAGRADLVLLLNSDTLVPPGAIDRLVAVLEGNPSAAAVGPRLVNGQGRAELSFGRMIAPLAELRQKVLVSASDRGWRAGTWTVERLTRRPREVDWVSGACLLVWRADAEAVGLLDERFFMYAEDVDFCAALRARGRRVLFTPAAEIVHLRGRSGAAAPSLMQATYRRSQVAFYNKHHPRWAPWLRRYLRLKRAWPPP